MADILDELRCAQDNAANAATADYAIEVLTAALAQAYAEIERLRALAGAVSAGDGSFREITTDLPRSNPAKHQVD